MQSYVGRAGKKVPLFKKKLFWGVVLFALLLSAIAGYYAYSLFRFTDHIIKPNSSLKTGEEWTGTGRVNIALIGVDERPGEGPPRGDSMMVLSIDPETKQASMFSVLRDTYYKIPDHGFRKMNEAQALGGPDLVKETLSNFMQLPIHYYVKTNFEGFANIVDVLGGIDMYVDKDMYWPDDGVHDINLKKGQQHLDGEHALMYVRFRHEALSDYARTERQRKFLGTLAQELKSTSSIVKMPQILDAIKNDIETDMSVSDMLKLGKLAANLNLESMDSVQLPPVNDSTGTREALFETTRDGGSVIIPDLYETRVLVHKTLNTGKVIVKTDDDQEPMVHHVAPPKKTPTPVTPEKQTPTPAVPNTEGKTAPVPGTGSGTGSKTPVPGGNSTNGSAGGGTQTKPGGTGTPGTSNSGTGGQSTTVGGSSTGATPPPVNAGGTPNPGTAPGTGTTGTSGGTDA